MTRSRVWLGVGVVAVIALGLASRVLGSTFSWLDIAAYTIGVAIGALIDLAVVGGAPRQPTTER